MCSLEQGGRAGAVLGQGLVQAEPGAVGGQVEIAGLRRGHVEQQAGQPVVESEKLAYEGLVHPVGRCARQSLLDDDAGAVDVGGQLVAGGRDAGLAGAVDQRAAAGPALGQHGLPPVGPAHIGRADLAARRRALQDQPDAGDVGYPVDDPRGIQAGGPGPRTVDRFGHFGPRPGDVKRIAARTLSP